MSLKGAPALGSWKYQERRIGEQKPELDPSDADGGCPDRRISAQDVVLKISAVQSRRSLASLAACRDVPQKEEAGCGRARDKQIRRRGGFAIFMAHREVRRPCC